MKVRVRAYGTIIFWMIVVLVGILAFNDYGISADEPQMRQFGEQIFQYVFLDGPTPVAIDWRFHNPISHVFFSAIRWLFSIGEGPRIWLWRHLLSYALFVCGLVAVYRIGLRLFKDWKYALLTCGLLLLSPRVFAHSFYNPKDIPALVFFTMSMSTLFWTRDKNYSWQSLVVHALFCALSTSVRTSGLLVPLFTGLVLMFDTRGKPKDAAVKVGIFGLLFSIAIWAVWPWLWSSPIQHFIEAIQDNSSREGGGLYLGKLYNYTPWHYIFVWMSITTPVAYTAFFLAGAGNLGWRLAKAPYTFIQEHTNWLLVLLWYIAPIAAMIVLRVGIFNEWRHVLFVYPAFLLIAVQGIRWLITHTNSILRITSIALITVSTLWTTVWMIRNHPRQYVYFSIPSSWVEGNFEKDYWGLSFYEALTWIANNERGMADVYTSARIGHVNTNLLFFDDWVRMNFTEASKAEYIVDNYHWNTYQKALPDSRALYTITVDGLSILSVYQGPDTTGIYPANIEFPVE